MQKMNNNDIRKTVKKGKQKGKLNNKRGIKKFFIILLLAIIVVAVFMLGKNRKINIKQELMFLQHLIIIYKILLLML